MEKITMIHEDEYGRTEIVREFDSHLELSAWDIQSVFADWMKAQGFTDVVINRILKSKEEGNKPSIEARMAALEKKFAEMEEDFADAIDQVNFAFQNFG